MPLGWVRYAGDTGNRSAATERNVMVRQNVFDQIAQLSIAIANDVFIVAHRVLEADIWTRWETASDEKVCPVCGPYTGHVWKAEEGPQPPLHPNCRCRRVYAFTTWRSAE